MRILVFHGYLLRGTGSNVYNASLAAALVALGHEVHLLCQDDDPFELAFVDAVGSWEEGDLRLTTRREPARCTVYRPNLHGLLPVYVADRYAGIEARPFPQLTDDELDRYLGANIEAVREVAARAAPDVALANHLVMGPLIVARALAGRRPETPYAVKVHGSALEYTVKPHPRFLPHAREGLAGARAVLVGSRHTAESLWSAIDDPDLAPRTRLGPPGVDVDAFSPASRSRASDSLRELTGKLRARAPAPGDGDDSESAFARDDAGAADALEQLDPVRDRLVAFVGKLIVAKGIDLLLAAWPLVLDRASEAKLVVVGFGAFRAGAQTLCADLAGGDLAAVRNLVERGREAEGGPPGRLAHLGDFLAWLDADAARRERYLAAARRLPEQVVFTGRLEHAELASLLPACDALAVPSTFPEAFGMVAAEAAACGALPVSADHSGLGEVSRALAAALPEEVGALLSFELGPGAVPDLADRLARWLEAPAALRERTARALVAVTRERYSWEGVARVVIAAAQGRLDELPAPPSQPPAGAPEASTLG